MLRFTLAPLLAAISACHYADHLVIHNDLGEDLEIDYRFDLPVEPRTCDDFDSRNDEREAGTATIPAGRELCLVGPVTGPGGTYDLLDELSYLQVRTETGLCLGAETDADLDALRARFTEGEYRPILIVDPALCPSA